MQSQIIHKASHPYSLSIKSCIGQITQKRNHVKMYPWRANRQNRECYLDTTVTPYTDRHNINEFKNKRPKKPWQIVIPKNKDNRFNSYVWNENYVSDPKEAHDISISKFNRLYQSIKDRGQARETLAYNPPSNVKEQVISLYVDIKMQPAADKSSVELNEASILGVDLDQNRALKFSLLTKCVELFNHDLPSSLLNDMQYISNVVEYFSTPVRGVNPYDALLDEGDGLPVNLSLISEPIRFNKDTDEFFKGYSAYPGIISKVPGIRGGKKYQILNQDEFQWPDI